MKKQSKSKKEVIHMAYEYPCSHCGFVEFACGEDGFGNNFTTDETKVTCKSCKEEIKNP